MPTGSPRSRPRRPTTSSWPRATSTPRTGCGRWRSGATSRRARLSELFGASTLSEDKFIRTLGWRQAAERDLGGLSADARKALDAYAEGVNAWIDDHAGSLSTPFVVTGLKIGDGGLGGYHLARWTAVDSLAWQKVQAWQLGGNYDSEVFRMLADAALGDSKRTDDLFPPYDPSMPVITPSGLKGSGGAGATAETSATTAALVHVGNDGPVDRSGPGHRLA